MSKDTASDLILIGYWIFVILFGFFCLKPKLVFYVSALIGLAVCALLFEMRIYIELGFLAHTIPFAFVGWWISRKRQAHNQRANKLID
jgi:hypothetical protein